MANIPGEQLPDVGTSASEAIPVVDIPEDDDAQIPGEAPLVAHDRDDEPDDAGALVIPDSVDDIAAPIAEPEDAAPIETADLATPDLDAETAFDRELAKLHQEMDRAEAEKAVPKPGEVDETAEPEQPIEQPESDRPAWLERALGAPEPTAPADVDAMIDQQVVTTRVEAEEEAAEKRDAGAAGLLSKLGWDGKFNKSERDEWIKGEREAGEWSEKYWQNVRDKYITPMIESELGEDGAEMRAKFGGSAAASSWFKDWIVDRVDRNIAGAKRRQFFTTEMEAGLREGAQRSYGRNLADSTGRAFVDTGLGAPIGGYGRFREIAGTEVMQRGIASGSKTAAAFGVMEYAIGKGYSHFGNWISKMGQELFPEDEARQSEWGTLMGNGAGTMAALVGPSLTASIMVKAGPKTLAAMAGNSPEALAMLQAQNARVGIAAGTTVSGGTGALMQAESEARSAEDAMKAGKTKADGTPVNQDDVNSTFFWNLPLGATEALPLGNLFGGSVRAYLGSVLREMAEEGGQEFAQTWGSNVIASLNYDPERKWDEGAWEGAAVGFILGGGVESLNQAASRLKNGEAQQKQTVRGPDGELIDAPVQEAKVRGGAGGTTMNDAGDGAVAEDEAVPEFSAMYTPKDGSVDPNDIEQYLKMYGGGGRSTDDRTRPVTPEVQQKNATKALSALDKYAASRGMSWSIEQGDVVIRDRNGVAATGAANPATQDLAEMAGASVKAFGKSSNDFADLDNYLAQEGLDIAKGDKPAKEQRDFIAELAASLRGEEVAPGEKTATAADYGAFLRILDPNHSKLPASKWAEAMGVTEEDMKALVAQAKKDGYIRGKRGKWLRTGAARGAADRMDTAGQFKGGETVRFKSAGNAQWQVDGVNADGTVRARRWLPGKKKWAGAVKTFAPGDKTAPIANPDKSKQSSKSSENRIEPTLSMPAAAEAELRGDTAESAPQVQETAPEQTEQNVAAPENVTMLKGILESHGIDTAPYGTGEAKSLASLLKELTKGESQLLVKDGKLTRRVSTLALNVFHTMPDGRRVRLYESRQDFADGRSRTRNMNSSLGEKLAVGETPETSVARALQEEIGVSNFTQMSDITREDSLTDSPSFPGLRSEYAIYRADVEIDPSEFKPEYTEVQKEKTNYMHWKDVETGVRMETPVVGSLEDLAAREAAAREYMANTPAYAQASDLDNPIFDTTTLPGYGTDAWKAKRVYKDGNQEIKGFRNAYNHLANKAMDATEAVAEVKFERQAFLLLGYPGSGKSTTAESLQKDFGALIANADDAKLIIPEYMGGKNTSGVHEESSELGQDLTRTVMGSGANIIMEKIGSSTGSVAKLVDMAKANGYKIVVIHVDVPKAIAMERAISRFKKTGRAVGLGVYDSLDVQGVYDYIKAEGKADGTAVVKWIEPEGWSLTESDGPVQGIRFGSGVVRPGAGPGDVVGAGDRGSERGPETAVAARVERASAERQYETGRGVDPEVTDYAEQIARASDAGVDVSAIIDRVESDRLLSTEDARDLAAIVGYPSDQATKEAALQTVRERAAAVKEGIDGTVEDRLLGIPASEVSGSGVSPAGSLNGEGGNAGAALQGGGPGRPGDAGNRNDQSGEQPGSAGDGVRGQGAGIGSDTAASAGDGAARRDPGAALDEADQDALDTVVEADLEEIDSERDEALPSNYVITDADEIGKGGAKAKVRGNIAAIRIIRNLETEGRAEPTADEKAVLVKYVGWGAFSQDVFATHKPEWAKERAELADLLSADEIRSARASTLNAHYTSPEVIKGVWAALEHLGVDGGFGLRAIEPAAGVGHFIGLQPEAMGDTSWTAVELDQISGKITKALYGGADVRVQGFETVTWPDDHFDLAISNVPFAAEGPYDPAYKKKMTLHDYFFVKSLDKVRPGGIVAFITSNGTLDKKTSSVRRQLANKATFLGAIRLPGGSKGAFKSNAGTDVTTDIIFLRKRVSGEPLGDQSWIDVGEVKTPEGMSPLNQYFVDHPEMMLGKMRLQGTMYTKDQPVLIGPVDAMETRIREAAALMLADAFVPRGQEEGLLAALDIDTETDGIKSGAFYEKEGKLYRKVNGVGEPQKLTKKGEAVVRSFLDLRDAANALLAAQSQGTGEDTDSLRFDLNEAHDAFVAEHGPINTTTVKTQNRKDGKTLTIRQKPNMAFLREDPDAYKVAAIENYDEKSGTAAKTAIFSQDVIQTYERPAIAGPTDALAVSLNENGRVDMKFIADRLGISEAEAAAELGEMVYLNPKGESWEISGQYLAGDVVEKLSQARTAAELDSRYQRNVDALEKVQPETIPRDDIGVQFGAVWVPGDVYSAFIKEVLGANVGVVLTEQTSQWSISQGFFPESAQSLYGTERVNVAKLVQETLNNKPITVYDKITTADGEKSVVNPAATVAAQARANALRQAFQDWKYTDEARGQRLEAIYNHRFNRLAPENYDGSHLTFPGMARVVSFPDGTTGTIDLTPHRVNTIWRIVQKGNTLIDHVVGAGKTWTMIMSAMEQKRLGLIQRPMMAVPNHMLEQFSTEFLQAYPGAKLLIASKEEMSLAKRKEFAGKIAAEKWDGIIITHDAFGRIAMSDKAYQDFFNEQIDELTAAKEEAAKDEGKRVTVKNMEKAITSLKNRLQKYTNRERKDTGVTFEELGVDFIYYDEAHLAKNLGFSSQHQRVKGVNAQSQSQRAMDLFVKIRYLEKLRPGRSAVFATGTPISNTMAELFVMQKYLQLDELKAYGLDQFDAWASTFGSIVTKTELAPDGRTFRDSTAFSEFVNVPELNAIWSRVADTKTAEQLQLPRPKLLNGSPTVIEAEPTPGDLAYIEELIARAEAVKTGKVDPEEDNMLKIVSEGRKIATDGRLINTVAAFNENGKIARATEEIFKRWQSGKEPGLVQMVFLDMGVPGGKSVAKPVKAKKGKKSSGELGEIEAIRDQLLAEAGADPESAEADTEASEIISGAFDLYADLKARLVARGIPANQIAFIHDAKGDEGKARLFADVKSAKVRVLFGSTPKMGVGTNVQKRLIAMHHLDAPWKPAEVEQRDGRILRQGNMNPEIEILRYVTRQSFDSYMWQTLERKARFISQYKSGQRGARRMEDIDNPLPEAALLKAAASGDSRILEHAELSKEVQSLEGARAAHMQAGRSAGAAVKNIEASLARTEKYLAAFTADAARVTDTSGEKFLVDLTEIKPGTGKDVAERKAAGEMVRDHLLDVSTRYWSMNSDQIVGKISGFDMGAKLKRTDQGVEVAMFLQGDERYDRKDNFLLTDKSDPVMIMRRWETILKGVPASLEATTRQRETQQKDLPRLRELAGGSAFPNQAALDSAKARLAALEAALRPQEPSGDVAPAQEIPEGKVSIEDFSKEVADLKDRLGVRERPKSQLIGSNVEDAEIVPDLELASLAGVEPSRLTGERRRQARREGFNVYKVYYHGTQVWNREDGTGIGNFDTFDRLGAVKAFPGRKPGMDAVGSWFSDRPEGANMYAGSSAETAGAVYPVYLKVNNPWRPASFDEFVDKGNELAGRKFDPNALIRPPRGAFDPEPIRAWLKSEGYDGIVFREGVVADGTPQEVTVALEPEQIRSVNAQFDPANAGGPLLLGSLAGLQTRRYTGPALAPREIDGLVRAWKDLTEALDTTAAREPTRTEAESLKLLDYIQKRIGDAEVAEFPSHVPLSFRNVWDNPNLNVFQKLAKLDLLIKRWLLPDWQNIRIQDVPVNRLVYAQKGVVLDIVRKYVKQDGTKDGATSLLKYMPETGQFLVLDGTHRAMSERVRGRQVVRDAQVIYDRPWHHRLFGIKDTEVHDLTATLAKELADYGIDPTTFTEEGALRSYLEGQVAQQHSSGAGAENEQAAQLQVAGELLLASLAGVTKTGTDLATLPIAIEQRIAQMKQGSRLAVLADGIREFKEAADETIVLAKKAENVHIPDDATLPQLQMLEISLSDLMGVIEARQDIEDQLEGSASNIESEAESKLYDVWNELDDLGLEATSIGEEINDAVDAVAAEHGEQFWLTPEEAALEEAGEDVDPIALRDPAEDARGAAIHQKLMLPYVPPAGAVTPLDIFEADLASWRPVVEAARTKFDAAYSALEAADFSREAGIEFMRATAGIDHDFMEAGVYRGKSLEMLRGWHDDTVKALNDEMTRLREQVLVPIWHELDDASSAVDNVRYDVLEKIEELKNPDPNLAKLSEPAIPSDPLARVLTPRAIGQLQSTTAKERLEDYVRRALPPIVAIRVLDRIRMATPDGTMQSWMGSYNPVAKIMQISLEYGESAAFQTANHEMIHALRRMGLFTKQEWKLLVREARKHKMTDRGGNDMEQSYRVAYRPHFEALGYTGAELDAMINDLIDEEYVASMAEKYKDGEKFGKKTGGLLQLIFDLIDAVRNWWNDDGFFTVDQILADARSGKIAQRPLPLQEEDIVRMLQEEVTNGRDGRNDGRNAQDPARGGFAAGQSGAAQADQGSGRRTVDVTSTGILAAASQRILGGTAFDPAAVETRRVAQGFTTQAWHSTTNTYYSPSAFRPGKDFGFHVAIGSPRAANNRVGHRIGIIDKIDQALENLGRAASMRGAKPLQGAQNASILPLWVKAKNPLRMPDIGDWAAPDLWYNAVSAKGFKGPKRLAPWIKAWMVDHKWESRPDQIINSHEFSFALAGEMARLGYDSVIYKNEVEDSKDSLFVWRADQVRSAYDSFDDRAAGKAGFMASLPYVQMDLRRRLAILAVQSGMDDVDLASIRLWHGSKHQFTRFSLDAIGTGEGAQMYGWGLYFAQSLDVAQDYAAAGDGYTFKDSAGQEIHERLDPRVIAEGYMRVERNRSTATGPQFWQERQIRKAAIATVQEEIKAARGMMEMFGENSLPWDTYRQRVAKHEAAIDVLRSRQEATRIMNSGHTYQVVVDAEPEAMLDIDLPYAEQTASVKAAIAKVPRLQALIDSEGARHPTSRFLAPETRQEAEELARAGIPGMQYYDAFSRVNFGEEGTRNYVVFDDSLIRVTERDGNPVEQDIAASIKTDLRDQGTMAEQMTSLGYSENGPPKDLVMASLHGVTPDERLERAREQGFDVDKVWYHGSAAENISSFDVSKAGSQHIKFADAVFFSSSEDRSAWYRDSALSNDLRRRQGAAEANGRRFWQKRDEIPQSVGSGSLGAYFIRPGKQAILDVAKLGESYNLADEVSSLRASGHDSIVIRNHDEPEADGTYPDELLVFDPSNIRSVNAKFAQSGVRSDLLLASLAGVAQTSPPVPATPVPTKGQAKPLKSIPDLMEEAKTALGLTVRNGRLSAGAKAAASRAGAKLRAQFGNRSGVIRMAAPNDIVAFAHEAGHALEVRPGVGGRLDILKKQFAKELTTAPTTAEVILPQGGLPPTGYTGIELNVEQQDLLAKAMLAQIKVIGAPGTPTDPSLKEAAALAMQALQNVTGPKAAQYLMGLAPSFVAFARFNSGNRALRMRLMNDREVLDALAADFAVRFAATGTPAKAPVPKPPSRTELSEGFAEFFRRHMTDQDAARAMAPQFFGAFEEMLNIQAPGLHEQLDQIHDQYQALQKANPVEAIGARFKSTAEPHGKLKKIRREAEEKGWGNTVQDHVYSWYASWVDDKHPLKVAVARLTRIATANLSAKLKADGRVFVKAINDPYKLMRLAAHSKVHATNTLQRGVTFKGAIDPVGPSFWDVLAIAFKGNKKGEWDEALALAFNEYLGARRMMAEFERFDKGEREVEPDLTNKRQVWAQAVADLEQANPQFADAAKALYQFNQNMLTWKFQNGFIDPKMYAELQQRVDYVPLNRVMDDKSPSAGISARGSNKASVIKQQKNSSRDIIMPLESIAQDVYAFHARKAVNDVIGAMTRLAEAAGPYGGAIAERVPAEQMKGSKVNLREVIRNAAKAEGLAEGDKDALLELIDDMFDQKAAANIFRMTAINDMGESIVYLWENGERVAVRLGDDTIGQDIFALFTALGKPDSNGLIDAAALGSQVLRAGITRAPSFIVTNFLRDQVATWILSEHYTPYLTGLKGGLAISKGGTIGAGVGAVGSVIAMAAATGGYSLLVPFASAMIGGIIGGKLAGGKRVRGGIADRYSAFAGLMGGVDSDLVERVGRDRNVSELRNDSFFAGRSKGATFLRVTESTEAASRLGHFQAAYERAIKDGFSPEEAVYEAAYAAHDVLDFSRRGSKMVAAARIVTFLNVAVQGMDSLRRSLTGERNRVGKEKTIRDLASPYLKAVTGNPLSEAERLPATMRNSAKTWVKLVSIGLLGVALTALYDDDPDHEEFNDQQRATNWFFKLGGRWYKYPKPFELAFFSNLFEAAYAGLWKQDPRAREQFTNSLWYSMLPPHEIPVMNLYYEMKTGHSMFGERQIVPQALQGLPPEFQFTAYTSEWGKVVGKQMGWSPAVVDHFTAGITGTLGRDFMTLSDVAIPAANKVIMDATGKAIPGASKVSRADKSVEDQMIVSRFMRRAARGALSTERFWDNMADENGLFVRASKGYKSQLDAGNKQDAKDFVQSLPPEKKAYAYLEGNFKEQEQDAHPLNRAKQVIGIMSSIRKGMTLGVLFTEESKKSDEPTRIVIDPQRQRIVNEILEDLSMREARNALVVIGDPGWAQKTIVPTAGLMKELEKAVPEIHAEIVARMEKRNKKTGAMRVYPFDGVKKAWPQIKERLVKDGPDAQIGDLVSEAAADFEEGPAEPYRLERKRELPGMMRLGGPQLIGKLPKPMGGEQRPTNDRIEIEPIEDGGDAYSADVDDDMAMPPEMIPSPLKPVFTGPDWDQHL